MPLKLVLCIKLLKQVSPETIVVVGGPEVSHVPDQPYWLKFTDWLWLKALSYNSKPLCRQLLTTKTAEKYHYRNRFVSEQLQMPYDYYSIKTLKTVFCMLRPLAVVHSSEFCLSALDKNSKSFSIDNFWAEMEKKKKKKMIQRGARHFKFIDRTFNLKASTTVAILEFFYIVWQMICPSIWSDSGSFGWTSAKNSWKKFPENVLQFEDRCSDIRSNNSGSWFLVNKITRKQSKIFCGCVKTLRLISMLIWYSTSWRQPAKLFQKLR